MNGMIGVVLRVTHNGECIDVPITPRAAVNFERYFKTALVKAFSEEQKSEQMYYLAWECVRLSGRVVKPFDGWLDDLQQVEFIWSEEEPAPLGEGA